MRKRLPRWLVGWLRPASRNGNEPPSPATQGLPNALTLVNQRIGQLQALLNEQYDAAQRGLDAVEVLERCAANAWDERESLRAGYYELVRDVLRILDDCQIAAAAHPDLQIATQGLEWILCAHRIQPVAVAAGDPFLAERCCCEELADLPEHPPGSVVQILETGYIRWLSDGSQELIRPARVIVNKNRAVGDATEHEA